LEWHGQQHAALLSPEIHPLLLLAAALSLLVLLLLLLLLMMMMMQIMVVLMRMLMFDLADFVCLWFWWSWSRYVESIIQQEMALGIPSTSIAVGGFSQGGAMSLLMLRSTIKLGGVVGLSSYLPMHEELPLASGGQAGGPTQLLASICMHHAAAQHTALSSLSAPLSLVMTRAKPAMHATALASRCSVFLTLVNPSCAAPAMAADENLETPVLLCHGDCDQVVHYKYGEARSGGRCCCYHLQYVPIVTCMSSMFIVLNVLDEWSQLHPACGCLQARAPQLTCVPATFTPCLPAASICSGQPAARLSSKPTTSWVGAWLAGW
jgi:predicted esterase